MTTATNTRRRGLATLMLLFLPLLGSGGAGWWYLRYEWPYVNRSEFVSPVASETLILRHDAKGSGYFGAPRSGARRHMGVDLLQEVGQPVHAVRSGRVREARYHKGFGYFIEIDHGAGLSSLYAHLSRLDAARGARVTQGQVIGAVGKSGNARSKLVAAHLHFELRKDGVSMDPNTVTFFHSRIVDPVHDPTTSMGSPQANREKSHE